MSEDYKKIIRTLVDSADDFVDARWRGLRRRMGWNGTPSIQPYVGYANESFAWMHGRVLTNPPQDLPSEDDNWWDNLSNMYQRIESDEVPGVEIEIEFAGNKHVVVTDEEGYFHLETERVPDVRGVQPWKSVSMRIINNSNVTADESLITSKLSTPPETARVGIISDIDDTILHTGVTNILTLVRLTFLHNARTRKPLAGVASLYRGLQDGIYTDHPQNNPVFYVSSSPWNLHDLLEDFLDLNSIPAGPILLRDLGFDENKFLKEGHNHKLTKARKVMAAYPDLPFILFGDSGQEDAKLYAEAAVSNPDQIKGIFIRDVDLDEQTQYDSKVQESVELAKSVDVPMFLIRDSIAASEILQTMDLLEQKWMDKIDADTVRDMNV